MYLYLGPICICFWNCVISKYEPKTERVKHLFETTFWNYVISQKQVWTSILHGHFPRTSGDVVALVVCRARKSRWFKFSKSWWTYFKIVIEEIGWKTGRRVLETWDSPCSSGQIRINECSVHQSRFHHLRFHDESLRLEKALAAKTSSSHKYKNYKSTQT